jgi:hypothetical protein
MISMDQLQMVHLLSHLTVITLLVTDTGTQYTLSRKHKMQSYNKAELQTSNTETATLALESVDRTAVCHDTSKILECVANLAVYSSFAETWAVALSFSPLKWVLHHPRS